MSLLNLLEEFIMFEKIRKMKNKKGFTLVELIVVLSSWLSWPPC